MVVDGSGNLIVGFGDHMPDSPTEDDPMWPQDDSSSYGKFVRIDLRTGSSTFFARGTRNPQGLMMDRDGTIWETEHGPKGGDELNTLQFGANYGWPYDTYGTEYDSFDWPLQKNNEEVSSYVRPVYSWVPSVGISNLIQIGERPEAWSNDLLVASLQEVTLYRLHFEDSRVVFAEPMRVGERIRDLIQWKEDTFLLWTDLGTIMELAPAKE